MIRRVIYAAAVLAGMLAVCSSCLHNDLPGAEEFEDGYVEIRFEADVPPMPVIQTRAVDPDGMAVQTMTLFCFDSYGFFITTVRATLSPTSDETGTFTAKVPQDTHLIHFLGNQNMLDFKESDFYNKSEAQVMAALEGSSGMMVYWARFKGTPPAGQLEKDWLNKQLQAQGEIKLIRNHALISVNRPQDNGFLAVNGFAVCNTSAFGTVAPYHHTLGFVWGPETEPFVTLPGNTALMSDVFGVTTDMQQYVFESENSADNPVSVILRGYLPGENERKDLYYRVLLIDNEGDQLLIRRNYHYKLNIEGALSYGQETFEAALDAPATNNVWISIQDNIDEVSDNEFTLKVAKTSEVLGQEWEGDSYAFHYTLKRTDGGRVTTADIPDATWLDGNTVGGQIIDNELTIDDDGVGNGTLTVTLNRMGNNEKLEGTILLKKGLLQRKIKVILIKTQSFRPAWVASQVYGLPSTDPEGNYGEQVTLMFTVPETCPAELFPLRILIGVEDLDVRAAAGMSLPVVRRGEKDFGEEVLDSKNNPIEYKFVYTAQQPGVQRVYFRTILPQAEAGVKTNVTIEAEHFTLQKKEVTYTTNQYMIEVYGLNEYDVDPDDHFANDENIFYRLVPQKRNAYVQFTVHLHNNGTEKVNGDYGVFIPAKAEDEFLIYSQNLDHIPDDEVPEGVAFDCSFLAVNENYWTENGRVFMFWPRAQADAQGNVGNGDYQIYMRTRQPRSAEVVRIASNIEGEQSLKNPGMEYAGRGYRSTSFELANYNPFRFAAQIDGQEDTVVSGNTEEPVTELKWKYRNPTTTTVDIAFDVTSFRGTDNKSADPFGEAFEIYIDAPMLTIDESRLDDCNLTSEKLRPDPTLAGRFIYTVEADRDAERKFGAANALREDKRLSGANVPEGDPEPDQSGERKVLPFRTNQVVSAGDITLSSNEEKVVFFRKTFRVSNESITGAIEYQPDGAAATGLDAGAFVTFTNQRTGSRIGSMSVVEKGRYELRLRKEYNPGWFDNVELHCTIDGTVYHNRNQALTLGEFVTNPHIVLVPATE